MSLALPANWRVVKLSDVGKLTMGQSPPGASYNSTQNGLPLLNGAVELRNDSIRTSKYTSQPTRTAQKGDLLFCIRATIGNLNEADQTYCLGRGVAGLRVHSNYSKRLIGYYLESLFEDMRNLSQGGVIKGLKKEEVEGFEFYIPESLQDQERIADIIDASHTAIQLTSKIITESKRVKKGLLHQLITRNTEPNRTGAVVLPNGWSLKPLSEVASVQRGKFSQRPRNDPAFYGGDIPFIQTGDVVASNGRITNYSQTLNEKGLSVSKLFPKGTIVMTIAANIGATAILDFDSCFPDSLVGIKPNKGVLNIYLEYYLQTKVEYLNSIATQSAQKNINLEKLSPLEVLVPTEDEQLNIASVLTTIDRKIAINKQLKTTYQNIKKGLLQDLLTGAVLV